MKIFKNVRGTAKNVPSIEVNVDTVYVGYRHFRTYMPLRKSKRLIRRMRDMYNKISNSREFDYSDYCSINRYICWIRWCNQYNLYTK